MIQSFEVTKMMNGFELEVVVDSKDEKDVCDVECYVFTNPEELKKKVVELIDGVEVKEV